MVDEELLCLLFIRFGAADARLGCNGIEQPVIGVVDVLLVGFGVGAYLLLAHISRLGVIGGDYGAFALKLCAIEQLKVTTSLIDAGSYEDGVAALTDQTWIERKVKDDVSDNSVHPRLRAEHVLESSPLALQFTLLPGVEIGCLGFKPLIHSCVRTQPLVDVTGFINQIKNYLVFHTLAELVGVNVTTENLQAGGLILLEQRCTGEADKDGVGQQRLHYTVQLAALGAVAFIHENE